VANSGESTVSVNKELKVVTVSGFTPVSGPTGEEGSTTVTVSGENFSTTPADNVVMFGGVQAEVTAATATELTVTAPWGATWQPLSVTVVSTGLTGYSYTMANPFIPTFGTTHTITGASFDEKEDFTSGTTPIGVAIGDLDGDGKPDLAVTNNGSGINTVSVFRNTSATGVISSASFAAKVDFTTGTSPMGVAMGDLDGDGKPELAVTNSGSSSASVSVFRNTSTEGTLSFDSKVDFAVGVNPRSIAIGDLDGDGKPDLVTANGDNASSTISLLRNISTVGTLSFATKVNLTSAGTAYGVAIGDLDGDGMPDLAVANHNIYTVSVFRNISAVGVITSSSFAAKVDLTVGKYPYSVAIGDLDGDGKPDLATANSGTTTVSVLRNASELGSLSFDAMADFDTGTGSSPYGIAIGDLDGDGKPDLAATNYTLGTVSVFRNISTAGAITTGSFDTKVDYSTGLSPYYVAIGDIDGNGKPEMVTANSGDNTVSVLWKKTKSKSVKFWFSIP